MGAKFFLLSIFFFAFIKLSAQMDGVHLNMRLHPVQILSVNSGTGDRSLAETASRNYVTVSSTAGFEVNMYRRINENEILRIADSSRGTVQQDFSISNTLSGMIRKFDADPSSASDHLVLTLISR